MIALGWQMLIAFALDMLLGDPRWFPHPVRIIGGFATGLEEPMRKFFRHPLLAGCVTVLMVVGMSGLIAIAMLRCAYFFHPIAGDIASIIIIYFCIAARDLSSHSMAVARALRDGDMERARILTARIVSRQTSQLDEAGLARAAVETVAENTVDGITGPLFFAALLGPAGAIAYKAASTLDSTFGFKNEKYLKFGWASARLDDLLNYIPARLTVPVIMLAACILRMCPINALRIVMRDGRKHASPNSGLPEAAFAGAMGVKLGGADVYFDEKIEKPTIGDSTQTLTRNHITKANILMFATSILFLSLCAAGRILIERI